jgi:Haem-binding domain
VKGRLLTMIAVAAVIIGASLGAAQFVRLPHTNPPVRGDFAAPSNVREIIRRACYDCHSNETRWPWYSQIAPASWLAYHHVTEARARLNFSEWTDYTYDPGTEAHKLDEIERLIKSRVMPPWYYRMMHLQARLTDAQRAAVLSWIEDERSAVAARAR